MKKIVLVVLMVFLRIWSYGQEDLIGKETVSIYNPRNLYELINGAAPAYLSCGFLRLEYVTYELKGGNGEVQVFKYDMKYPVNAYAIYSLEKSSKVEKVTFVKDGYRRGSEYFFRKGRYYVQVSCSDSEKGKGAAEYLAKKYAREIEDDDVGMDLFDILPRDGLDSGSINFFSKDGLGFSFMEDTVVAKYEYGGKKFSFFATKKNVEESFSKYVKKMEEFGKVEVIDIGGKRVYMCEDFGRYAYILKMGGVFCGIFDCEDRDHGKKFLSEIILKK